MAVAEHNYPPIHIREKYFEVHKGLVSNLAYIMGK